MNNENTIYDNDRRFNNNEDTQYDDRFNNKGAEDESTTFDETRFGEDESTRFDEAEEPANAPAAQQQPKKKSLGKRMATAFGVSAALGAGAAVLTSGTPADEADNDVKPEEHPEWTDGEVAVAQSVNDDMSFGEAFSAARSEVGAGGVFEWHGNIYNTYTKEEWDNMSQEQRDEYGSHFNWHASTSSDNHEAHVTAASGGGHATAAAQPAAHTTSAQPTAQPASNVEPDYTTGVHTGQAEVVAVSDDETGDAEVEILGVHHDDDSGATYANLAVGGHDAVLVDLDDNNTFDVLAIDVNDDNQITENEVIDVSQQNITLQSLGVSRVVDDSQGVVAASDDSADGIDAHYDAMEAHNDMGMMDDMQDFSI